ncbi:SMP-30/gluconolactonase/LRE family protein [bacterium]|nr:SMP-30/gluconolactonase/LRE family protein [bacterium]
MISSGHSLAESPGINRFSGHLFWVDIDKDAFFEYCPDSRDLLSLKIPRGVTSVHALGESRYLATGRKSIYKFDCRQRTLSNEEVLWESIGEDEWRFNDSYLCPSGVLVVGTKDLSNNSVSEARVGLMVDGRLSWLDTQMGLANGMALDQERRRFYCCDSLARRILVWDLGRSDFPSTEDEVREFMGSIPGEPDGMEIDAEGNIWVALWGAGKLICLSPEGAELRSIEVGAQHVSSLSFVSTGNYNCLITTATSGHEDETQLSTSPLRGGQVALFEIDGLRTRLDIQYDSKEDDG